MAGLQAELAARKRPVRLSRRAQRALDPFSPRNGAAERPGRDWSGGAIRSRAAPRAACRRARPSDEDGRPVAIDGRAGHSGTPDGNAGPATIARDRREAVVGATQSRRSWRSYSAVPSWMYST